MGYEVSDKIWDRLGLRSLEGCLGLNLRFSVRV